MAILFFRSARKKPTNLFEDVDVLLPIKFRQIPFNGFRGKIENVSANRRLTRISCYSNQSENTNLVGAVEILLPVEWRWNLFSGFRDEAENMKINHDGRSDDGRRTTRDHNSALEPSSDRTKTVVKIVHTRQSETDGRTHSLT